MPPNPVTPVKEGELERLTYHLDTLRRRISGITEVLNEKADRVFGASPAAGAATPEPPAPSGFVWQIDYLLRSANERVDALQNAVARFEVL
jgi:hypothetical protein